MGDREQLCFLFQEQEDLMLQKTDWIQSKNFEWRSLRMENSALREIMESLSACLIVNKHLHVGLHGTQHTQQTLSMLQSLCLFSYCPPS